MDPMNDTHGALQEIGGECGADGLALVAALMDKNARDLDRVQASLYESEKAAHERTKAALDKALADLDRIRFNVHCLMFGDPFNFEGRFVE